MGIFTRARDIITANINAILDEAEDPEKLVTLMVREMEDTLIELKASCAGAMAAKHRIVHDQEQARNRTVEWEGRARRAVDKGRDDLAREALHEKRRYAERVDGLDRELAQCESVVNQYQDDIKQLEEKLEAARERKRVLVQRHVHALNKRRAQMDIRRMDASDVFARFDRVEHQIDRLESEADLVNFGRTATLRERIDALEDEDDIEEELRRLKTASTPPPLR